MERSEPTAELSFAAMRERSRFGMAIAAMIRMIATTISNSISEKPFCFFMYFPLSLVTWVFLNFWITVLPTQSHFGCQWQKLAVLRGDHHLSDLKSDTCSGVERPRRLLSWAVSVAE